MTPERAKELLEQATVMILAAEGEAIEICDRSRENWKIVDDPSFAWDAFDFRIKPQPKYIPFTAKTFREHKDRWLVTNYGINCRIIEFGEHGVMFGNSNFRKWAELLDKYKFDDTGEPCGQKIENTD